MVILLIFLLCARDNSKFNWIQTSVTLSRRILWVFFFSFALLSLQNVLFPKPLDSAEKKNGKMPKKFEMSLFTWREHNNPSADEQQDDSIKGSNWRKCLAMTFVFVLLCRIQLIYAVAATQSNAIQIGSVVQVCSSQLQWNNNHFTCFCTQISMRQWWSFKFRTVAHTVSCSLWLAPLVKRCVCLARKCFCFSYILIWFMHCARCAVVAHFVASSNNDWL